MTTTDSSATDALTQTRSPEADAAERPASPVAAAGGIALAAAAFLPWVTVTAGLPVDLGAIGVDVTAGRTTVGGHDTAIWPVLLAAGLLATALALAGRARRCLIGLGALTVTAGAGLWYYLAHVIDMKTADRSVLERTVADLAVGTHVEAGPYVLLGAGAFLVLGSLARPGGLRRS